MDLEFHLENTNKLFLYLHLQFYGKPPTIPQHCLECDNLQQMLSLADDKQFLECVIFCKMLNKIHIINKISSWI